MLVYFEKSGERAFAGLGLGLMTLSFRVWAPFRRRFLGFDPF